jgi:alpha-glucosidase
MRRGLWGIVALGLLMVSQLLNAAPSTLSSPDRHLQVTFAVSAAGEPHYSIQRNGATVLQQSRLGLVREDADFSRGLTLVNVSAVSPVRDDYELLTSKRRLNKYSANRQVFTLRSEQGAGVEIQFQVSNDGVAFRYVFPEQDGTIRRIRSESSSFNFLPETHAWLQPVAVAKSGWGSTNPSYEEIYEKDIVVGAPAPTGAGWIYPALFRSGDTWLLLSETGLVRNYCGTRLQSTWRSTEYNIVFPDPLEGFPNGAVLPESTLPWTTPWRLIVVGDLATVVESNLGADLAAKPAAGAAATPADGPGKASWSWPLLGDDQTVYDVQKRFIDYAAEMGWRYTLIDALWDKQIGYERVQELVDYARAKNVKILLWYNSAGDWNTAPQTPRDVMLTRESRLREFERLKQMGIAGLKVDFFGGDGQSMIQYYQDILEDAARFGLLMNFHGATLPRGWHRTYPNLMTMEAIRGMEFVTFEQQNAEDEPTHAAMLPFTRNVFDPMDFTPVVLDRINNIERRTSSAFELATSVLFTSGIQHYAEIPEGMARAPAYVREFMKRVPSVWDDVKFLAGEPGKFVVLARRSGKQWYVAGINAERASRELTVDLAPLGVKRGSTAITDGEGGNLSFREQRVELNTKQQVNMILRPRGGFVMIVE